MPAGAFNEYSPQEQLAQARAWLRGLPITSDNLNRAMMALSTGQDANGGAVGAAVDRMIAQSPTPSRRQARPGPRPAPQAGGSNGASNGNGVAGAGEEVVTSEERAAPVTQEDGPAVAGGNVTPMPTQRRGTVNAATPIDYNDPTAGMFEGAPPRQADETGVDPISLAMSLGLPLAAVMGGAAMGARTGTAVATRQPLITGVNRPPPPAAAPAQLTPPVPQLGGPGGAANALPAPAMPMPAPAASGSGSRLATDPRRGQQPTGDMAPSAQPGTTPTPQLPRNMQRVNPPARNLRQQLARRRIEQQVGRGR